MQPGLWHHRLPQADWWNHASSWFLSNLRRYDGTARQCSGSCAHPHSHGSSGWERYRKKEGWDCKSPFLLEFSALPPLCVCMCVSVFVCESVREEGTFSSQPPAALLLSPGKPGSQICLASCWKKGKDSCVFFCTGFSTVDWIFTHTYMYPVTHERQRDRAGEWDVEWLTIRMYLSGRLL